MMLDEKTLLHLIALELRALRTAASVRTVLLLDPVTDSDKEALSRVLGGAVNDVESTWLSLSVAREMEQVKDARKSASNSNPGD